MKKTLLILVLLIVAGITFSQCLPNGITTDPAAPVNNQLPSKTNWYFDWTQPSWPNHSTCQPASSIESPFYKTDNLEALRAAKDMLPQDGWELIRRDFGYTDLNTPSIEVPQHTYFILYNKFTGILRVLLRTCSGMDYNGARIMLKFHSTSSFQSALLDFNSTPRTLSDPHIADPSFQSVSVFVNDQTKWFYADFPMTYDPCTCNYTSKLNVVSHLIQNSQIQIEGSVTGTITTITNGQGSVNNDGSYSFKDLAGDGEKFKKIYTSIDEFINKTKAVAQTLPNTAQLISALTSFQTSLSSNSFLKTGLAAVPWLKDAVGLLDLFAGGGKSSPQTVKLMPLAVNLSMKATGSITTSNQYHDIVFTNPGSLNAQTDPAVYPFYNEVLGVFNLMSSPVMQKYATVGTVPFPGNNQYITEWTFKLKDPLKWVLNPASKLEVQDAQLAYVVQSIINPTTIAPTLTSGTMINSHLPTAQQSQGFDFFEGTDAKTGRREYRTEYVNFNCLGNDHKFTFRYGPVPVMGIQIVGDFYLKLMLNLRRLDDPNAQNVLLVVKIPVKMENATALPGGSILNPSACVGGMINQATASEISSFCSSTTYTNNRSRGTQGPISIDTLQQSTNQFQWSVVPNPAQTYIIVNGKTSGTRLSKIQVFDMLGRVQLEKNMSVNGNFSEQINIGHLAEGVYVVIAKMANGTSQSHKIIIKK